MGRNSKGGQGESQGQKSNSSTTQVASPALEVTPAPQTLKADIIVRLIKMFDMGWTNILFGIPALFVATLLNEHVYAKIQIGNEKDDANKTTLAILFEVLICLTISGIMAYILRNLLQMIPFPFENVYGFHHMQVGEVKSGMVISFFLFFFATNFLSKVKILQIKISNAMES